MQSEIMCKYVYICVRLWLSRRLRGQPNGGMVPGAIIVRGKYWRKYALDGAGRAHLH